MQPASAFCHSAKLSVCVSRMCSVSLLLSKKDRKLERFVLTKKGKKRLEADMSKASYKTKKGESSSQYRQCVPPCPRFITSGDTHSLCVVCLGVKHAESALEGAGCPHCERLPLRTLRSWRGNGDGRVPISILTCQIHCPFSGIGSAAIGEALSPPSEGKKPQNGLPFPENGQWIWQVRIEIGTRPSPFPLPNPTASPTNSAATPPQRKRGQHQ